MSKCSKINATIRRAKREDMVQVYNLIKALADYHQEEVKFDASVFEKDGFDGDSPAYTCIVAELPDGKIIGHALCFASYSTWFGKSIFLEDLYVQDAFRGTGIGKQLFLAVAKIAQETPSKRLDFHCLSSNPAVKFYESVGAVNMTKSENWQFFKFECENLDKLL